MNLRFTICGLRLSRLVTRLVVAGACVVVERLPAQPSNTLPTLIPAYGELPPTFWEQHKTIVIIGLFVLVAVAALVLWNILNPQPAPDLPPEKVVREALGKMLSQPEDGKLASEVSQILRRYAGEIFGFAGGEMTTAEFCRIISGQRKLGAELSETIANFLGECDVRKFSPAVDAAPIHAASRALEIVAEIERQTRRQDAAAPSP